MFTSLEDTECCVIPDSCMCVFMSVLVPKLRNEKVVVIYELHTKMCLGMKESEESVFLRKTEALS